MGKFEDFQSGHWETAFQYRYFVPSHINCEWTWESSQLSAQLEKAALKLGELNSYAQMVPNLDLFIQLHVTKEAVLSSRIEGTQTNMEEAVLPIEEILPERRDDWQEVQNYIQAMNEAIIELEHLPLSSRLIRNTHATLLTSVRGDNKLPGNFRTSQNWIGGHSISDAVFIPPVPELVGPLMTDLEFFLHNDQLQIPALVKIAMAHYQFETIHPFLDGNGRTGRLLITLFLVSQGVLSQPLLYLSSYFERDRNLYYNKLTNVRTKNEMLEWILYFLIGVERTATEAIIALRNMMELKDRLEAKINREFGRRSQSGQTLLKALFKTPVLTVDQVAQLCELSYKSANELMQKMQTTGIIREMTGQQRNRVFIFEDYLKVFGNG